MRKLRIKAVCASSKSVSFGCGRYWAFAENVINQAKGNGKLLIFVRRLCNEIALYLY